MATVRKWLTPDGAETLFTTELNSLANNVAVLSAALDADAQQRILGMFELNIAHAVAPAANTVWTLYLVRSMDGSAYEDTQTSATYFGPSEGLVWKFRMRNVATTQILIADGIPLPPLDFKVMLGNSSGQAAAASGNTLKLRRYTDQSV